MDKKKTKTKKTGYYFVRRLQGNLSFHFFCIPAVLYC